MGTEMARPWRLAKSLMTLRDQVNHRWPKRRKTHDGTIGDKAHAKRVSDHNPSIMDDIHGVVSALDITHDPKSGCDAHLLAEHLRTTKDPRIKYCLTPDTPILHADLTWHAIGDAGVGDKLVAFDERGEWKDWHAVARKNAVLGFQKMRTATIEEIQVISLPCRKVATDRGSVTCSNDHAWLLATGQNGKYRSWRATDNLQLGSRIQYFADPWKAETSFDAGWIAGIFDGEGCLSRPEGGGWMLSVTQKEGDVLERLFYLLDEFEVNYAVYAHPSDGCHSISIRGGLQGMLAFLGRFRSVRLTEKAIWDQIWSGHPIARSQSSDNVAVVQEIRDVGRLDVVALQTSTRTLIANGLYSHNCISNGRIFNSSSWTWRKYTGSNPHKSHIHISVKGDKRHYDSMARWLLP